MVCSQRPLRNALCALIFVSLLSQSALSSSGSMPAVSSTTQADQDQTKKEKKQKKRAQKAEDHLNRQKDTKDNDDGAGSTGTEAASEVTLVADTKSMVGDVLSCEGYVNVTMGDMRLQADRVTFNEATGDMVAEGNVIFDQGANQRVTAKRAELNWKSSKGVFWDTTGFTNRTQTGDYVFFTAERAEKTGAETYMLTNADVTACEDIVPKWVFHTQRAELKLNDRLKLYKSVFRVKHIPAFVLPYAWIPATRTERKSGFLIPSSGSSNAKGRTLKIAYYQTLGQSADITFRNDIYSSRGIGTGVEFRGQTSDDSYVRMGVFTVKDRLFGPPGEDQGGTAFVAEGVQYLPHGWLAVGNVSLVSSLQFRQVFSDDISQVVDPRRESNFYANNNAGNVSFNLLASNETTSIFRPSSIALPNSGTDFDIRIRQAPQIDVLSYPRRFLSRLPVYWSVDTSLGGLKREESVADGFVLTTPTVQRFDVRPKVSLAIPRFAGIAVTPSLALRETFYTSSIDPRIPVFDPDQFSLTQGDPRLDPTNPAFQPGLRLFDPSLLNSIVAQNISRHYSEFTVDVRPPDFEKIYRNKDGTRRFKHIIEPYLTYRTIRGIGDEFNNIIRFDERDAVANTNEFEYAIVNRFFTTRRTSDLGRKRSGDGEIDEMETLTPDQKRKRGRSGAAAGKARTSGKESSKPGSEDAATADSDKNSATVEAAAKSRPLKLESGEQTDLSKEAEARKERRKAGKNDSESTEADDEENALKEAASNEDSPVQPYEILSIRVAQKYFLDRTFGGALVDGRRNQFYPLNTLSGFNIGGRARSFSPANIQVRYRPLSSIYGDVRMDVGSGSEAIRNLTVSVGLATDKVAVRSQWYLSRRIDLEPNRFEAGTFPGNLLATTLQYGSESQGIYAGTRINYDFTDRVVDDTISQGRLRHSRSYFGYGWDCCGVQFNYNTFKAGLRNESAFSFTFTLAGIGSFGSDQFSQLGGGGRGGRKKGKKLRRDNYDDF